MDVCVRSMLAIFVVLLSGVVTSAQEPIKLVVRWDKVIRTSQTTPTLQVVVNPPLQRGTPVHDNAFKALHDLGADYARYVPWLPYPKLGVAELEPPKAGKASWDFSLIDPMTIDFLEATKGHSTIINFSTIPQWMYKTDKPVSYPADASQVTWNYEQGTELRDSSMKEVAEYYARLLAWYTKGGFTDEFGKRHDSGYHYAIPYWEVLNEIDFEHHFDPETYTRLYDEVVTAMKKVQPGTKFVGLALAMTTNPRYFDYFLDHKNHKPGIPLDFISYHFYAVPTPDQTPEVEQFTYFDQAEGFLKTVRYVEAIRKRLSPETQTTIDELGVISADDMAQGEPGHISKPIENSYWNLAGAMYAYLFGELTKIGIDVAGEAAFLSELNGQKLLVSNAKRNPTFFRRHRRRWAQTKQSGLRHSFLFFRMRLDSLLSQELYQRRIYFVRMSPRHVVMKLRSQRSQRPFSANSALKSFWFLTPKEIPPSSGDVEEGGRKRSSPAYATASSFSE